MTYEEFLKVQPGDRVQCRTTQYHPVGGASEVWHDFFVHTKEVDGLSDPTGFPDPWTNRLWVNTFPWQDGDTTIWFRYTNCRLPVEVTS